MLSTVVVFAFLTALAASVPAGLNHTGGTTPAGDPVRTVFEFPNGTYVENLAVRPNGQVLVTLITSPELYLVDPLNPGHAVLVHSFPGYLSLSGIAEYEPDVNVCAAGNYSAATGDVGAGTWALWSVDLRGVVPTPAGALSARPKVSRVAAVPGAHLLNGVTLLSARAGTVLAGDISGGVIYRVDIATGDSAVVVNSSFTAAGPAAPFPSAGVDGLHVFEGDLYFTNIAGAVFVRVPIREDGTPAGPFTTVAHALSPLDQYDDFTFDCEGNAFLVTGRGNAVELISPQGRREVLIAGGLNSTAIAEPTSAAFRRGLHDRHVLYVTTAGGLVTPVDGSITIGGQLVAVTTKSRGRC